MSSPHIIDNAEACRNFSRGRCDKGSGCKFSHAQPPTGKGKGKGGKNQDKNKDSPKCLICGKTGHLVKDCTQGCTFCGIQGHGEKSCFKRKAAANACKQSIAQRDQTHSTTETDESQPPGAAPPAQTFVTVALDDHSFTFAAYDNTPHAYAMDFEETHFNPDDSD